MTVPAAPSLEPITVRPVETDADLDAFLNLPARVYRGDDRWVPPLRSQIAKELGLENPFRTYGTLQAFVAYRDEATGSEPVGRIVAAVNDRLVAKEDRAVGLFGYFECIDNLAVARALLDHAIGWLRDRGMVALRGPIDLSTHIRCLMLVDGFEDAPYIMMPYNPPYYPHLMEQLGFEKAKDAYAYTIPTDIVANPIFERAHRVATRSGVTFRPVNLKGDAFTADAKAIYRLFTQAFKENYSSTPRTEADFLEEAKDLQSIVNPDFFPIAEIDGEMVGFLMALPDYNIALRAANGRLNFWGILKFLWARRQINRGRVLVICSLPEYMTKRIPLALIYIALNNVQNTKNSYRTAELGYIYEDNYPSRKLVEAIGGTITKTYRIYEQEI
ncbi:MAG: hypothetical protein Fur0042_04800 [Cyanophyceae cyanobacterium]